MNKSFECLIEEAIEKLTELQKTLNNEFRDTPPILWFGNVESPKPKVLVISANPNRPDFPEDNPRVPYCTTWKEGGRDIKELENDFNNYFRIDLNRNPATNWFGKNNVQEGQGRIEQFLNGLDASFYDGNYKYQAIHIDLLPFSTATTFTKIDNRLMAIEGLPEWVDKHVKELIELIQPQLIIINGNSNFNFFNLCVNIGAQPYKALILPLKSSKETKATIWVSNSKPTIIATSINMGSYCMHSWDIILDLGRQVKKKLEFE